MEIEPVLTSLRKFAHERDWDKFHSPENLAKSISIEAGELLECFQWGEPENEEALKHELADVLTYCLFMAMKLEVDPMEIVLEKLQITRSKYPVEKAFGKTDKYDQL